MIGFGSTEIAKAYLGGTEISKMYLGDELVFGGSPTPILPYDAELEYLQSDGGQYFTLPVAPSEATDAFEIVFRRTENTNQHRFCHADGESTFQLYVNGNGRVAYSVNNSWSAASSNNYSAIGTVKHSLKVDYKNKVATYDFIRFTIGTTSKQATNNLVVTKGYVKHPAFKGLIYSVKFWRNDTLIYDLIPVRKSGVGYFYDKIGDTLYSNEGTGAWTLGYDKYNSLESYSLVNYIENTNTTGTAPYIDTGISSRAGTIDMTMVVKWNQITSSLRQLMGADYGPFFGCEGKKYSSYVGDLSDTTPSTTEFQTVIRDTYTDNTTTAPRLAPLTLFKAYNCGNRVQTSTTYVCRCKLKSFQIKVNNVLVRDLVAVQHPSGVYGMFDKIEHKFYDSSTNVEFSGG